MFARPWFLLLGWVPVAVQVGLRLRPRPPREPFAAPAALAALLVRRNRIPKSVFTLLAWLLLVVGAAGPRWGTGDPDGVARGHDVIVLLDFSASMLAADTVSPTRWQSAVGAAAQLGEWLRSEPGNRVAIVVFAAHPELVVPLTADAAYLQTTLAELDGAAPPRATHTGEGDASGTRIGEAISRGAALCDRQQRGQVMILLSDGDDPARDREWSRGVTAARAIGVPVHVVGLGGVNPSPILRDGKVVEAEIRPGVREPVMTWLHDQLLRELATEARGEYLAAGQAMPDLSAFTQNVLAEGDARELLDAPSPSRRDRAAWFLLAGVGCLLASWFRTG